MGEPLIKPSPVDETEHARVLEEIEKGRSPSFQKARPDYDAKQAAEFAAQSKDGRKIEDYRYVLERCGFKRFEPHQIPPMMSSAGGRMHTEARWYNLRDAARLPEVRMAMTEDQICAWFPGGPGEFWSWYQTIVVKAKAKAAGIALPRTFKVNP